MFEYVYVYDHEKDLEVSLNVDYHIKKYFDDGFVKKSIYLDNALDEEGNDWLDEISEEEQEEIIDAIINEENNNDEYLYGEYEDICQERLKERIFLD